MNPELELKRRLASRFRKTIIPSPGCVFIEGDYSGIEAVEVGWFSNDPNYIRLAKLGVHAFVTCQLLREDGRLKEEPTLSWSDEDLSAIFKDVKSNFDHEYNQSKRCVHGKNYGLTVHGMVKQFPEEFPTVAFAEKVERIYYGVAPKLKPWQDQVRELANEQHFLGGPGAHPYNYKHYFYSIYTYDAVSKHEYFQRKSKGYPVKILGGRYYKVSYGEDAKRCVAFFPQSTAAGVIKEALLRLFTPGMPNYIGDCYYGQTCFRLVIHDSIFLEVPKEKVDYVLERLAKEMLRMVKEQPLPEAWEMGSHLSIGVEIKMGSSWSPADMKKVALPNVGVLGVEDDYLPPEIEGDEEEDDDALVDVLGLPPELSL